MLHACAADYWPTCHCLVPLRENVVAIRPLHVQHIAWSMHTNVLHHLLYMWLKLQIIAAIVVIMIIMSMAVFSICIIICHRAIK